MRRRAFLVAIALTAWAAGTGLGSLSATAPARADVGGIVLGRAHAGDTGELLVNLLLDREDRAVAAVPRLHEHAAEPAARQADLEAVRELGRRLEDAIDLGGERRDELERCVCRSVDRAEHHALILERRQLFGREHIQRNDREREHEVQDDPDDDEAR